MSKPRVSKEAFKKKLVEPHLPIFSSKIESPMAHPHTRDNPDPTNIIPDNIKRKRCASDRAQGIDAYFKTAEPHWTTDSRANSRPSLNVTIPKDLSKPDGDAVENGFLLSADELEARGHFVHSPSDAIPILKKAKEHGAAGSDAEGSDAEDSDVDDKTYKPPKKSDELNGEVPEAIYGSDGEEMLCETEYGRKLMSGS